MPPAEEEIDDEPVAEVAEGEEGPVVPTHDPFSFRLLTMAQAMQASNGLRHNDHLRYRQYCSRRLRRLYNVLKFKHGRGRYKGAEYPANFEDVRWLEIPLVQAERAWSYGMQLKSDNANAASMNAQWRHHSIARFAKACKWGRMLESVCKVHADPRTQLEAETYSALLEGTWLVEQEKWKEALAKLTKARRVCDHLGLASEQAESALFKAKVQELAPMIRECRYNLGLGFEADEEDGELAVKAPAGKSRKDLSELSYRGQALAMPSEKIKGKLMKCIQLAGAIKVEDEEKKANDAVIETYGSLSVEFSDTLRDIHSDMIAAGTEGQTAEWRMLESFARELSICMNVERNLVLLWTHFEKLDRIQDVTSLDSRKTYRPDEGMRFCDLLKEDITGLRELPETTDKISKTLAAYVQVILNCRCLFLALCQCSVGKTLEAAALIDMLHNRVEDVDFGGVLPEPIVRLQRLVERIQKGIPTRTAVWRCRVLAQLCTEDAKSKATDKDADVSAAPAAGAALEGFGSFPPKFRDIPCKPLLCDLAYQSFEAPDLSEFLPKKKEDKKSVLGRAATGLGSRLSGLWGGGKK